MLPPPGPSQPQAPFFRAVSHGEHTAPVAPGDTCMPTTPRLSPLVHRHLEWHLKFNVAHKACATPRTHRA